MKRQEEEWANLVADFIDQWNASSMEEEEGTSEIIIRFYHNININIFFRFSQQISCAIFIYLFIFFHVSDRPVELMGGKHVFAALLL